MRAALLALALVAGCRPHAEALPRIGLAVSDSARAWCAEFVVDSTAQRLEPGQPVTIVFSEAAPLVALAGRLGEPHSGECPAAFPQPRWFDYTAYRVDMVNPALADTLVPGVALIIAGDASWARGVDGVPRADLDGDGQLEEARRCTADEGEHFTIWSTARDGHAVRRWHEYFDWGAFTDPTCRSGEDGR